MMEWMKPVIELATAIQAVVEPYEWFTMLVVFLQLPALGFMLAGKFKSRDQIMLVNATTFGLMLTTQLSILIALLPGAETEFHIQVILGLLAAFSLPWVIICGTAMQALKGIDAQEPASISFYEFDPEVHTN